MLAKTTGMEIVHVGAKHLWILDWACNILSTQVAWSIDWLIDLVEFNVPSAR